MSAMQWGARLAPVLLVLIVAYVTYAVVVALVGMLALTSGKLQFKTDETTQSTSSFIQIMRVRNTAGSQKAPSY